MERTNTLSLTIYESKQHMKLFIIMSVAGSFSLFPLIFKQAELPTKTLILTAFYLFCTNRLKSIMEFKWNVIEFMYLSGFIVLHLYVELGHSIVFGTRLEFLPLMITSLYCSIGIGSSWIRFYQLCFKQ